jgi:hypothetical protein
VLGERQGVPRAPAWLALVIRPSGIGKSKSGTAASPSVSVPPGVAGPSSPAAALAGHFGRPGLARDR